MGILLVRHSDAVDASGAIEDAARWLTAAGRARAEAAAGQLAHKGLSFDRFVSSPRVRALQTAEIYARRLGFPGVIEELPELSFTAPASDAVRELLALCSEGSARGAKRAQHVAAFGHMPTIAEIAQQLANEAQARPLSTSEAVWIENERVVFRLAPPE